MKQGPYVAFGAWLKSLRKQLRMSQEGAELKAKSKDVTQAKLTHAERGHLPDPALLRTLAGLYRIPHEDIIRRWVAVRYGVTFGSVAAHTDDLQHRDDQTRTEASDTGKIVQPRADSSSLDASKPLSSVEHQMPQKGVRPMTWERRELHNLVDGLDNLEDQKRAIAYLQTVVYHRRGIQPPSSDADTG